jgi:hypothetical protein
MSMITQREQGLEAFCQACPPPEEVTAFLSLVGFRLVFQLPAYQPSATSEVAPLPAQFHYERYDGMSVIYLEGPDRAEDEGERFPPHASRWWVYAGSNPSALGHLTRVLKLRWNCSWHHPSHDARVSHSRPKKQGETHVETDS